MARQHGPLEQHSPALAVATGEPELSDELLLERARATAGGEREELLDRLYRRHYATVAGWCLAISRDQTEAEELAQEVFLKAHRAIASFRGDSRFTTWLYVITRRAALDRAKSTRRNDDRADPIDADLVALQVAPEALQRCERSRAAEMLRLAVREHLDPLESRALRLHYVTGMTLPEITALLGLRNRSGAKALLVSALRKLRRAFGNPRESSAPIGRRASG